MLSEEPEEILDFDQAGSYYKSLEKAECNVVYQKKFLKQLAQIQPDTRIKIEKFAFGKEIYKFFP